MMKKTRRTAAAIGVSATILAGLLPATGQAQRVAQNFENETATFVLQRRQSANQQNAAILPVAQLPAAVQQGEVGNRVLGLTPSADNPHLSVVHPQPENPAALEGETALSFKADLFLPPSGAPCPTLAVAAVPLQAASQYAMYRFGVLDGGEDVVFSFANGTEPGAQVYKSIPAESAGLRQPGWNEFEMLFSANGTVVCRINGETTSFSPVTGVPLMGPLAVGVSVSSPTVANTVYTDNWVMDRVSGAATRVVASSTPAPRRPATAAPADTRRWFEDPEVAWAEGQRTGKPLLVFFTDSRFESHEHFRRMLASEPSTARLLDRAVPVRLDVSQPLGESNANHFRVYRIPTLLVLGTDAQEKGRLALSMDETTAGDIAETLGPVL